MDNSFEAKELRRRFLQRINSPEYLQACQHFQSECDRLSILAQQLIMRIPHMQDCCKEQTVRREYASGSTLHRGFYCPSPVYDLIVGNTKRGKILKRVTSRSNPSHEYGFCADGRLLWCQVLQESAVVFTEYLDYQEDSVRGITVDGRGEPITITEEIYENGRLIRYLNGLCLDFGDSLKCYDLNCEFYSYDEDGLYSCETHNYMQPPENPSGFLKSAFPDAFSHAIYRSKGYVFERQDGYLVSYTDRRGHTYWPGIQRKA